MRMVDTDTSNTPAEENRVSSARLDDICMQAEQWVVRNLRPETKACDWPDKEPFDLHTWATNKQVR